MITLEKPSARLLPSFLSALAEGDFIAMQLGFGDSPAEEITQDPEAYLARINDTAPFAVHLEGRAYTVSDHELLWIADGDRFLGTLALRYHGDDEILKAYAGHIGMAVRPGLLNKGYGPRAIHQLGSQIVDRMKRHGLTSVFATCNPGNKASRRLIEHFGGVLVSHSEDVLGTGPSLLYSLAIS